jgi:aerobic-type carbon monoxide dehydrogenase small subunit (CoxS/CutS family)
MMIQAASLLNTNPRPSVAQIKSNMNGHLCRCGTYFRILEAVQEAARVMRSSSASKGAGR